MAWVQTVVRYLRSHKPQGATKKRKIISLSPLCGAPSLHLKYKLLHIHTTIYKIDKQQEPTV